MPWSKPDFVEITLCMEVTAYVNTDDQIVISDQCVASNQSCMRGGAFTDYCRLITDYSPASRPPISTPTMKIMMLAKPSCAIWTS